MPRRPIPRLSLPGSPAGLVLHETRVRGPLARAELAGAAGLSRATCARAVAALIDAGLLAELPPEADDGAAGRPVARVRCADPGWCHVGVHLGLRTTLAVVADATGRTLRVREEPLDLPRLGQEEALDRIAALAELGRTRPLARRILDERADLLGRAVALVADVVDPGRVILAGAAFTDDPGALRHVAAALHRHSPVRRDVRVSRARGRITRDAAAAVALDALHADPLAVAAAPAPPDRPRSRPAPAPPPGRPRPAAARRTGVASPGTTKENHR
ncbi:hypothetical protein [Corynebacterium sp.]|uniref:hypothetical protein n=1 Tax=Corynebacterium sp. TaxID=1720 RepID=UPI0026DD1D59|nr:hypothetical protein [Corynebacterium sp.]MDO4609612.1 hypothetical protein [Corynebacterium sp.]